MSIVGPVLHGTVGLVLLAAAAGHLRRPSALRAALGAHDVLPRGVHRPVTVGLVLAEAGLGLALLGSVLGGLPGLGRWAGLAAALLFVGFAGYLYAVWRSEREVPVPCACGVGETAVGGWVVTRAVLLALTAGLGAVAAGGYAAALAERSGAELVVVAAATLTFAIGITGLPVARRAPDDELLTLTSRTEAR